MCNEHSKVNAYNVNPNHNKQTAVSKVKLILKREITYVRSRYDI